MEKTLEYLFKQYKPDLEKYSDETQRINQNKGMLKKNFNKWQRKIFLHIEDDKDLIAEKWAFDSFVQGVRCGALFMTEVLGE